MQSILTLLTAGTYQKLTSSQARSRHGVSAGDAVAPVPPTRAFRARVANLANLATGRVQIHKPF